METFLNCQESEVPVIGKSNFSLVISFHITSHNLFHCKIRSVKKQKRKFHFMHI